MSAKREFRPLRAASIRVILLRDLKYPHCKVTADRGAEATARLNEG